MSATGFDLSQSAEAQMVSIPNDFIKRDSEFWSERFGLVADIDSWNFYSYEWIDDLSFMPSAEEVLYRWEDAGLVLNAIKEKWSSIGWHGDGVIQLLWLPPFLYGDYFPRDVEHQVGGRVSAWLGHYVFHVKQLEDGISWLASRENLPWLEGVE